MRRYITPATMIVAAAGLTIAAAALQSAGRHAAFYITAGIIWTVLAAVTLRTAARTRTRGTTP